MVGPSGLLCNKSVHTLCIERTGVCLKFMQVHAISDSLCEEKGEGEAGTSPNSRKRPKSIPQTKKKLSFKIAETVLK